MINLIECKKLVVANKLTHEPVEINTGKKAFFALLQNDLSNLADSYNAEIEDVYKTFYQVSCDREKLVVILKTAYREERRLFREKQLEKQNNNKESHFEPGKPIECNILQWQTLEDLAIQHAENTAKYQVVLEDKGQFEVDKRLAFIGKEVASSAQTAI